MGLSLKFGENGMKLMPVIRTLEDMDRLNKIKDTIKKAGDLKAIEALLN